MQTSRRADGSWMGASWWWRTWLAAGDVLLKAAMLMMRRTKKERWRCSVGPCFDASQARIECSRLLEIAGLIDWSAKVHGAVVGGRRTFMKLSSSAFWCTREARGDGRGEVLRPRLAISGRRCWIRYLLIVSERPCCQFPGQEHLCQDTSCHVRWARELLT